MSNAEMVIIIISLLAAACGAIMMLACMAGRRVQLVKAYNIQIETKEAQEDLEDNPDGKNNFDDGIQEISGANPV
ncbi:MAG: hypothetical protein JEZ07_06545 [Phycisphaerae bacterium]|nr:hypothetical protein [Phycisphaerae bacterium]